MRGTKTGYNNSLATTVMFKDRKAPQINSQFSLWGYEALLLRVVTIQEQLLALLTTDVVPSPTSLSCRSASSQRTLAAGCSTSSSFRMVAPSLVMVTSCKDDSEKELMSNSCLTINDNLQRLICYITECDTDPDVVNQHLVKANRSQGALDDVGDG